MKKFYTSLLLALGMMASPMADACHLSSFHLKNVQHLGGNIYEYTVEFCVGGGREGSLAGASGYTGRWGVKLDNGTAFNSYPFTVTSPATGATYFASLQYGTDLLLYDETFAAPGWAGSWACVAPECGPIAQYCFTFAFTTVGQPNTITLLGAEGSGVGVAPYGCNGQSDMVIHTAGPIADAGADITACGGSTVSLSASASGGTAPYSYAWSNGATGATISVNPAHTTVYTIAVTDALGRTAHDAVTVTAIAAPVANAGPDRNKYIGYGATCFSLNGSATGGTSPYTYQWSSGATSASISACPSSTTVYSLTVTDANGCSSSDDAVVTVQDIRCGNNKVYVCRNGRRKCISTSQVNSHLNSGWTLGSCQNKWDGEEMEDVVAFSMYPNPADGFITVDFTMDEDAAVRFEVYGMDGRLVASDAQLGRVMADELYSLRFETSDLKAGIYMVVLQADNGFHHTERLQIVH